MEKEVRDRMRDLLERADKATSVKEIAALRQELSRMLVAAGEVRGARNSQRGNGHTPSSAASSSIPVRGRAQAKTPA